MILWCTADVNAKMKKTMYGGNLALTWDAGLPGPGNVNKKKPSLDSLYGKYTVYTRENQKRSLHFLSRWMEASGDN